MSTVGEKRTVDFYYCIVLRFLFFFISLFLMHPAGRTMKCFSAWQQFNTNRSSSNQWRWKGNGDGLSAFPDAVHTRQQELWFTKKPMIYTQLSNHSAGKLMEPKINIISWLFVFKRNLTLEMQYFIDSSTCNQNLLKCQTVVSLHITHLN